MEKYNNKYSIPSARMQTWDYGANGAYFITICTHNRIYFFGEIVDGKMIMNELGELAQKYWLEIPQHFPFVKLDEFVVMPNHTHGILIIDRDILPEKPFQCNLAETLPVKTLDIDTLPIKALQKDTLQCNVSTDDKNEQMAKKSPKSGTISTIIRSYKSAVTKNIRHNHAGFAWQPRFHDHIIRDANSFHQIRNYIANNAANWHKDKLYTN